MTTFDPAAATAQWLATLSPEEMARAVAYTQGGHWLILWGFVVSIAVALTIVRTNLLVTVRDRLERDHGRPKLASFVVGLIFLSMSWVLTLPWSIYAAWYREGQ